MLAEPDPLPGAQVQFTVRHWDCQVGPKEAGFHMGRLKFGLKNIASGLAIPAYHVIRPFARVPEGQVFRHYPVEHHLHVVSHIGVPVLVDGKGSRCVKKLYVH